MNFCLIVNSHRTNLDQQHSHVSLLRLDDSVRPCVTAGREGAFRHRSKTTTRGVVPTGVGTSAQAHGAVFTNADCRLQQRI